MSRIGHELLTIVVHFVPILLSTFELDSTVAEPHVSVFDQFLMSGVIIKMIMPLWCNSRRKQNCLLSPSPPGKQKTLLRALMFIGGDVEN